MIDLQTTEMLVKRAQAAAKKAYAPYSGFFVGAALLCADGSVYDGCNVENCSYPVGCCAERVALFKAVSDGKTEFLAMAVVGSKNGKISDFCPPCGMCRQALSEFCDGDFAVILSDGKTDKKYALSELLPAAFKKANGGKK